METLSKASEEQENVRTDLAFLMETNTIKRAATQALFGTSRSRNGESSARSHQQEETIVTSLRCTTHMDIYEI